MKVHRIYSQLLRKFYYYKVDEPQSSAINIIQKALGIPYRDVYTYRTMFSNCSSRSIDSINRMYRKRRTSMPIQYVIGEWEFRDLFLKMQPPVLIPRPETSILVDAVLSRIPTLATKPLRFLEIGCGSGAICLSLLQENPNLQCTAIDIKKQCTILTGKNAELNRINASRLRIKYIGFDEFLNEECVGSSQFQSPSSPDQFDFIVSNPPYIPSSAVTQLDRNVRQFEDHTALDGGEDGLDLIHKILNAGTTLVKPGGFIALEVDASHNALLAASYESNRFNWKTIFSQPEFLQDYFERDRFAIFHLKP